MNRNKLVTVLLIVLALSTYLVFWGVENEVISQAFAIITLPAMLLVTSGILIWNSSTKK